MSHQAGLTIPLYSPTKEILLPLAISTVGIPFGRVSQADGAGLPPDDYFEAVLLVATRIVQAYAIEHGLCPVQGIRLLHAALADASFLALAGTAYDAPDLALQAFADAYNSEPRTPDLGPTPIASCPPLRRMVLTKAARVFCDLVGRAGERLAELQALP